MEKTILPSVRTLAAVCLVCVSVFLPACSDSPPSPSPASPSPATPSPATPAPASPLPPSQTTGRLYTLSGVVTDVVRHTGIAGAMVEVINGAQATLTSTDRTGVYAISGLSGATYHVRAYASGYDPREQIIEVFGGDVVRADFQLPPPPPVPPTVDYGGVWTGVYDVTDCRDIDLPGFTQFHLCGMHQPQLYQFTLIQIGTLVSGTYKLVTSFYSCPCQLDGGYGEIPMAGSISPDGTLAITALGNTRGLVGATAELDLLLRHTSSSTITGTGTLHLRFGTLDDRSIGSIAVRSGTRP